MNDFWALSRMRFLAQRLKICRRCDSCCLECLTEDHNVVDIGTREVSKSAEQVVSLPLDIRWGVLVTHYSDLELFLSSVRDYRYAMPVCTFHAPLVKE